jgi:hypothetical protein
LGAIGSIDHAVTAPTGRARRPCRQPYREDGLAGLHARRVDRPGHPGGAGAGQTDDPQRWLQIPSATGHGQPRARRVAQGGDGLRSDEPCPRHPRSALASAITFGRSRRSLPYETLLRTEEQSLADTVATGRERFMRKRQGIVIEEGEEHGAVLAPTFAEPAPSRGPGTSTGSVLIATTFSGSTCCPARSRASSSNASPAGR